MQDSAPDLDRSRITLAMELGGLRCVVRKLAIELLENRDDLVFQKTIIFQKKE